MSTKAAVPAGPRSQVSGISPCGATEAASPSRARLHSGSSRCRKVAGNGTGFGDGLSGGGIPTEAGAVVDGPVTAGPTSGGPGSALPCPSEGEAATCAGSPTGSSGVSFAPGWSPEGGPVLDRGWWDSIPASSRRPGRREAGFPSTVAGMADIVAEPVSDGASRLCRRDGRATVAVVARTIATQAVQHVPASTAVRAPSSRRRVGAVHRATRAPRL